MTKTAQAYTRNTSPADTQPLPNRLVRLLAEARWLIFGALALYLIISLASYTTNDPGWSRSLEVPKISNWGGRFGAWISDLLLYVFGVSAWWWCVLLIRSVAGGYRRLSQKFLYQQEPAKPHKHEGWICGAGFALMLAGSVSIEYLRMYSFKAQLPHLHGGVLGQFLGQFAHTSLGFTGATLLLLVTFGLGFSLFFHVSWLAVAEKLGGAIEILVDGIRNVIATRKDRIVGQAAAVKREEVVVQERAKIVEAPPIRIEPQIVTVQKSERVEKERQVSLFSDIPDTNLPPLSLLDDAPATQETVSVETLEFTSRLIEKKLSDFGIEVKVIAAYPGPVITRYEIEPAIGVKGSQIVNLARDLARSLSLTSIRVVETIPGKNYMGLELPNPKRQIVRLS
ncbi:MAG: translocase FtsK, partial [Paucimonas sp.]|nr:translocase FtsK [Paucimonas sp.]